jgi:hypothetical protein
MGRTPTSWRGTSPSLLRRPSLLQVNYREHKGWNVEHADLKGKGEEGGYRPLNDEGHCGRDHHYQGSYEPTVGLKICQRRITRCPDLFLTQRPSEAYGFKPLEFHVSCHFSHCTGMS